FLSRNCSSASIVAFTTLCGLCDPIDLVSTFGIPTAVITARTGPPAITPVPSGAGLSNTRPEPNAPSTGCWMVVARTCTLRRFFFAASMPFLIAAGTSFALPVPKPTIFAPGSPTTTKAEKLRFLPPFTTFVTRLMETTCSFRFRFRKSMRLAAVTDMSKNPQPRCAGGTAQRLDAAVIEIPAAIEYHGFHTFVLGPLGDQLADGLRAGDVSAT